MALIYFIFLFFYYHFLCFWDISSKINSLTRFIYPRRKFFTVSFIPIYHRAEGNEKMQCSNWRQNLTSYSWRTVAAHYASNEEKNSLFRYICYHRRNFDNSSNCWLQVFSFYVSHIYCCKFSSFFLLLLLWIQHHISKSWRIDWNVVEYTKISRKCYDDKFIKWYCIINIKNKVFIQIIVMWNFYSYSYSIYHKWHGWWNAITISK